MSRQGYDDTDSIERVAALMRSEPGLARQAAIKRVVGTNKSNIRRIETKMQRAAATANATAASTEQHPIPDDQGTWPETLFLLATVALFAIPLGLWLVAPGALVYPVLGAYWLKLKFAVLVAGPLDAIGSGALATIEGHLALGDIGSIDPKVLTALKHDVTLACRNVIAAALAVTMVWAVCRLTSMPRDKVAPPRTFSRGAPLGMRLLDALREPRLALMAVSLLGAAAYMLPQMADLSIFTVLGITMHCMCSTAQGAPHEGGRPGAGAA